MEAQLAAGPEGLVLGGTLGQASGLFNEEQYDLVRFTVEKADGRVPVVINIAEQTTRAAVAAAQEAERCGASGLILLPPMRYKADDRKDWNTSVQWSMQRRYRLAEVAIGLGTEHVRVPRLPLEGVEREQVWKIIQDGLAKRPAI